MTNWWLFVCTLNWTLSSAATCIYKWNTRKQTQLYILFYSYIHVYYGIDTISPFFNFNLRVFTSKSSDQCRNYNTFSMWSLLFEGPKVIEQLAAQLFHGQMCVIPSLFHLQGTHKRSRVHFKCDICIWNLFLSNMKSKELSLSVKQVIIGLKH